MSLSMFRRLASLLILVVAGSCSGDLPSSAVSDSQAERDFGILRSSTSIVSLIRERNIRSPDLSAPDPLLQLQRELAKSDPDGTFAGITYDLTRGNSLAVDWLVQTPNRWGRRADDLTWFEMGCTDCEPGQRCPAALAACLVTAGTGGVEIMGIGRLGAGITEDFANQSELACDLMFGAAHKSIRIAQQDLGFRLGRSDTLFAESALDEMIDLMERDGDVYVVLSNPGSIGNGGSSYYNDVPLQVLAKRLKDIVQKRIDTADPRSRYAIRKGPDPVNALLCSRFHLAPFRFGPDDSWLGGKTIANHSKLWMVDDRIFYIGSDNMYPVNLQEFGFIVDDRKAVDALIESYWNPLWQWSRRASVSGEGVEKCIFREIIK